MQYYPTKGGRSGGLSQPRPSPAPDPWPDFIDVPANDNEKGKQVYPAPANDNKKKGIRANGRLQPKRAGPRRPGWINPIGTTQTILEGIEALAQLQWGATGTPSLNMTGWNPAGACRGGPEDVIGTWLSCARPFSPGLIAPGATIPGSRTQIMTMWKDNGIAGRPYLPIRIYTRAAQAQPQPNPWVVPKVNIVPELWPWADPMLLPVASPFAVPWGRPTGWKQAAKQPHFRFGIRIRGNVAPGVRPRPNPNPRPPPKGTKEKKLAVAIGGVGADIVNWLSEGVDAANAVWDAMPDWFKKAHRGKGLAERMQLLYNNLDLLDTNQALWNLLNEQGKDKYYAMWGKLTAKANRKRGMPGGLALGPAL